MPNASSVNFGSMVAPDIAAEQLSLARKQQLVDLLRKQATDPMEQQVVSGAGPSRVVPISPWQGIAKMASAYLSGKSQEGIDAKSLDLNRQMAQRYSQILGGAPMDPGSASSTALGVGSAGGSVGPTNQNAQTMNNLTAGTGASGQGGAPGTGNFNLPNLLRGGVVEQLGGAPAAAAYWEQYKPTDLARALREAGTDPSSAQGRAMIQANIEKQNYIAPVNARPGSIIRDARDPSKVLAFNPHVPEGGAPQFDAQGNVTSITPLSGATDVISAAARAKTAGEGNVLPYAGVDASGNPLPVTNRTAAATQGMPAAPMPPAGSMPSAGNPPPGSGIVQPQSAVDRSAILQQQLAQAQRGIADPSVNDADRQRLQRDAADIQGEMAKMGTTNGKPNGTMPQGSAPGAIFAAPPLGAQTGQEAAQTELSKKWTDLNAANSQAQTTSSYLENIKQLAGQAATGPFTNRLQFANSLLSLVGSQKATDATTANALLDKYSNQIVARLGGSGALGTDSARTLLQSAYPNAHMTVDAINEAADNLKGASDMTKAKAAFLQPHAVKRDPSAYSQREVAFDQNADPRIWQLKNMDAETGKKYLGSLPPAVQADLRRRAAALQQAGAF